MTPKIRRASKIISDSSLSPTQPCDALWTISSAEGSPERDPEITHCASVEYYWTALVRGAMNIGEMPIVVVHGHGQIRLCPRFKTFTIPDNCLQMALSGPGEILSMTLLASLQLLENPNTRTKVLEPRFVMRSLEDARPIAEYEKEGIVQPFTAEGKSPFEEVHRAKGGSVVGDTTILFKDFPRGYTAKDLRVGFNVFLKGAKKVAYKEAPKEEMLLSEIWNYVFERFPKSAEKGIALVLMSCNAFVDPKKTTMSNITRFDLYLNPIILPECKRIINVYEKADEEYQELPLRTGDDLAVAYPKIVFPIMTEKGNPYWSINIRSELKSLGNRVINYNNKAFQDYLDWEEMREQQRTYLRQSGLNIRNIEEKELPTWELDNPAPPNPQKLKGRKTRRKQRTRRRK